MADPKLPDPVKTSSLDELVSTVLSVDYSKEDEEEASSS